jgi:hypothetical protein
MKVNRKQNIETLSIVTFNQKALAFIPRFIQNFIIGIQKNPDIFIFRQLFFLYIYF